MFALAVAVGPGSSGHSVAHGTASPGATAPAPPNRTGHGRDRPGARQRVGETGRGNHRSGESGRRCPGLGAAAVLEREAPSRALPRLPVPGAELLAGLQPGHRSLEVRPVQHPCGLPGHTGQRPELPGVRRWPHRGTAHPAGQLSQHVGLGHRRGRWEGRPVRRRSAARLHDGHHPHVPGRNTESRRARHGHLRHERGRAALHTGWCGDHRPDRCIRHQLPCVRLRARPAPARPAPAHPAPPRWAGQQRRQRLPLRASR